MHWFKHGWGSNYSPVYDPSTNYYVDLSGIRVTDKTLLSLSSQAIQEIKEKYPPPYYLMLSGGLDSQLMLWCWKNSEVDFHPICVRYKHNDTYFNDFDLENIQKFSKFVDVELGYTEINIIDFLEAKEFLKYATTYFCTSPQICTYMYMSERYNGTIVFSGNFQSNFRYTNTQLGLLRYAEQSGKSIIPFFFMHNPELASKFLFLENHPDPNVAKFLSYCKEGAPLLPPQDKYTGFEKIKDYYDNQTDRVSPLDRLRFANMPSKRPFDFLFRYKLEEYIKYKDHVVYHGIKNIQDYRQDYLQLQKEKERAYLNEIKIAILKNINDDITKKINSISPQSSSNIDTTQDDMLDELNKGFGFIPWGNN